MLSSLNENTLKHLYTDTSVGEGSKAMARQSLGRPEDISEHEEPTCDRC
jgi:hypothetical protein